MSDYYHIDAPETGTYGGIILSTEPSWKSSPPVNLPPLSMSPDEFMKMALESIGADSKVWGLSTTTQHCIYVSAKSSVKEEILDKNIWKQYPIDGDGPLETGYHAQVDGSLVNILFMKPKRSVFDLVEAVGQPVKNLEGFMVSPPAKIYSWDIETTTVSNWFDEPGVGGVSVPLSEDDIPF